MKKNLIVLTFLVCTKILISQELGFEEKFAISENREVLLKELIPGTENYYYYHALHYQHTKNTKKLSELLDLWNKRNKYSSKLKEILNREALINYELSPKDTLKHIIEIQNLSFNHQKIELDPKTNYPTKLNQKYIDTEELSARYLNYVNMHLNQFENSAVDLLMSKSLSNDRRRKLLKLLNRPDHDNLVSMIIADLNYKYSGGFGSIKIHKKLLLSQLEECLRLRPKLRQNSNFITTYLKKLKPNDDINWKNNKEEKGKYLKRLWSFVSTLAPAQNSLKANILYHQLLLESKNKIYDKSKFIEFVKLPKNSYYVSREYKKNKTLRTNIVNLHSNYYSATGLKAIGNEETLVRTFLSHYFIKEPDFSFYTEWIDQKYLKALFAETKMLHGVGDMEKWYSMSNPNKIKEIQERIELALLPSNQKNYKTDEIVKINLGVKNVKSLLIKTFRINLENYYKEKKADFSTAIDLDGLIPNQESRVSYENVPIRYHEESFEFPSIKEAGIYVIDFIGNGKSCRAVIRKGHFRFAERLGSAGHVFTIFNEKQEKEKSVKILLDGFEYKANKEGDILIPYSNRAKKQNIIISNGSFASLDHFLHKTEDYSFEASFYCDKESLLSKKEAKVLIRPSLFINGKVISHKLLEQIKLSIETVDQNGIPSKKEVSDFVLNLEGETSYVFNVPEELIKIKFTLSAKIKSISQNKKVSLSDTHSISLNGIHKTENVADLHVRSLKGANGHSYQLEFLGKTGEAKEGRPISFVFKNKYIKEKVHLTLQTDKKGFIHLGALNDISYFKATAANGVNHTWRPVKSKVSIKSYNALEGQTIKIPTLGTKSDILKTKFSLLESRNNEFVKDHLEKVKIEGAYYEIDGLKAGTYSYMIKENRSVYNISVTKGKSIGRSLVSKNRILSKSNLSPLQIHSLKSEDNKLKIQLSHFTPKTRIHIVASRYLQAEALYFSMKADDQNYAEVFSYENSLSNYLSGRNIGEEYRYILERKFMKKYPGNMLKRPSLLLNPWDIRKTDTDLDDADAGSDFKGRSGGGRKGTAMRAGFSGPSNDGSYLAFTSLDFLPSTSLVLENLKTDKTGLLEIDLKRFKNCQQIKVLATNTKDSVLKEIALPFMPENNLDLRLISGLNSKEHFAQKKSKTILKKNTTFILENLRNSKIETFDTIERIYDLLITLNPNEHLAEFAFISQWPSLKLSEKKEMYSKYACHELNFFLYKKDPDFFNTIITPYLKNKKDKTFMDVWLLKGDLSPYVSTWAYQRLNIVERILLAQHMSDKKSTTARHIKDLYDLIPPNIERENRIFKTALKGDALSTATGSSIGGLLKKEKNKLYKYDMAQVKPTTEMPLKGSGLVGTIGGGGGGGRFGKRNQERLQSTMKVLKKSMNEKVALQAAEEVLEDLEEEIEESLENIDGESREELRRYFIKLDKTKEWVENNYYNLPIAEQVASLITVNKFWKDYAASDINKPFLSSNFVFATKNFSEMMFVLSVLDLPFKAASHQSEVKEGKIHFTPASSVIVFHKTIDKVEVPQKLRPILVSQNFFAYDDRYTYKDNEKFEKYVSKEFKTHKVYGAQIVITNPTPNRRKVDLLLQIPRGAMPVLNGFYAENFHVKLGAYSTITKQYYFYFPKAGEYPHFPVHVAEKEVYAGSYAAFDFHVVDQLSIYDTESWDYISQHGTSDDVLKYLDLHNVDRLNLNKIAFRMRDKSFFQKALNLLEGRSIYQNTLWSYGLYNNDKKVIREYLQHSNYPNKCGVYIDTALLTKDPVLRHEYQHKEYLPLVNARVWQLGKKKKILNNQFYHQYLSFMKYLCYKPALNTEDQLDLCYYFFLQDRVEEALAVLSKIDRESIKTKLQYDYFKAYANFYLEKPLEARAIAEAYKDYPVLKWRKLFLNILSQVEEINGKAVTVNDDTDRTQTQTQLADTDPSFSFVIEKDKVKMSCQNIDKYIVNYYLMDIELLFSRNPFVKELSGQFSIILPNATEEKTLAKDTKRHEFSISDKFKTQNVMVEIVAAGQRKMIGYYPNSLDVQLYENYGQVKIKSMKTNKPLSKIYIKVYARMKDGDVKFFKDGYSDLRGRFDYVSLNTNELDNVEKFSILIMSDSAGALVKETNPPKR